MAKRHLLQQAHKYNPKKHDIRGWLVSEKLDGMRAFWDSGITRGLPVDEIPWANTTKDKKKIYSTGLWSRLGKTIQAPDWWLDQLPSMPLDGELWCGRGNRQLTMSICRKHNPVDIEWKNVWYGVFDSVSLDFAFQDGIINHPSFHIDVVGTQEFLRSRGYQPFEVKPYADIDFPTSKGVITVIQQTRLPQERERADEYIRVMMDDVLRKKGEGLVIRNPNAIWIPERTHDVVKLKPYFDDEAVVVGYITGRETDKGSKLLGMMGAMIVKYNNLLFELSGFTDEERTLITDTGSYVEAFDWAERHPETRCPLNIYAKHFPRGTTITFKYRELSRDGVPIEASYFRKR